MLLGSFPSSWPQRAQDRKCEFPLSDAYMPWGSEVQSGEGGCRTLKEGEGRGEEGEGDPGNTHPVCL